MPEKLSEKLSGKLSEKLSEKSLGKFGHRRRRLSCLVFLVLAWMLLVPMPAYAYIDPATTSYIIQIVSGLIISLSVAIGVFFRRIQMWFVTARARSAALWVRANTRRARSSKRRAVDSAKRAGNAPEGSVAGASVSASADTDADTRADTRASGQPQIRKTHRQLSREAMEVAEASGIGRGGSASGDLGAEVSFRKRLGELFSDGRRLRERALLAALPAAAISFTLVIFGCIDLFVNNRTFFRFALQDILVEILLVAGLAFVLLFVVGLLLRGRPFNYFVSLLVGLLLVFYLQGNFLNINFGEMTGNAIAWENYLRQAAANTALCLLIMLIPFAVCYFSKKIWKALALFVPTLLIVMQAIALVMTLSGANAFSGQGEKYYLSDRGFYEVSPDENILVFVVDTLDQRYVDEMVAGDRGAFDERMSGFTSFDNNLSIYDFTYPSVLNMLTGARYDFEYPGEEFISKSWREAKFLPTLREQGGFESKIYTDFFFVYNDARDCEGSADNIETGVLQINKRSAIVHFLKLSLFRYAPHVFKPTFWISTDVFEGDARYVGEHEQYFMDDALIYQRLVKERLRPDASDKNFAFYHLAGIHEPYTLDANAQRTSIYTDAVTQLKGEFTILFEYFDQLRELGVWDKATIIITGDHGFPREGFYGRIFDMQSPVLTSLFVKPAYSDNVPMRHSPAPVNHDNLRPTVLAAAGVDNIAFGPTYFEVGEHDDVSRPYYWKTINHDGVTPYLQIFSVEGEARDFKNWKEVRRVEIAYWY